MSLLDNTIKAVKTPSVDFMAAARKRLDCLTKPQGSLGRLEDLAAQLAAVQATDHPQVKTLRVYTLAADHGVAVEGVSAFPQAVTGQMVLNFIRGGAGINVLAGQAGAQVIVADLGIASDIGDVEGLVRMPVGAGTKNFRREAAMSRAQAVQALETGISLVKKADVAAVGEMGIANTTSASAICSVMTGHSPSVMTGLGTGIEADTLGHKVKVIQEALELHRPDARDPLDVLSKVGGFEIAGMAGVMLGCAAQGCLVVLDGFISGAAALVAVALCPDVKSYMVAGHQSVEPGHRLTLEHLGLEPLLKLNLRLGEGTGAALAFPLIKSAAAILEEMATFETAGVSGKDEVSPSKGIA